LTTEDEAATLPPGHVVSKEGSMPPGGKPGGKKKPAKKKAAKKK
jgi:hypothetical protein